MNFKMLNKDKYSRLVLHKLEFFVYLGWKHTERKKRQIVTVDIDIQFAHPPIACTTDFLDDTFCYDTLNQTIKKNLKARKFFLLEHLTHEIYAIVKAFLRLKNKTLICVTKHPDLFFKSGGVSFSYGDKQL
jgi:FolB domain-containing protein